MQFGNKVLKSAGGQCFKAKGGQMTVELAVCIPVILAFIAVILNIMGYLNVCARFDRVAAEAVRIEASSPSYGSYGANTRAENTRKLIQKSFDDEQNSFKVETIVRVSAGPTNNSSISSQSPSFSLLSRLETFNCTIIYHPWPFDHFAGLRFITLSHQRHYTIDPYRPGVLL